MRQQLVIKLVDYFDAGNNHDRQDSDHLDHHSPAASDNDAHVDDNNQHQHQHPDAYDVSTSGRARLNHTRRRY